MRVTIKPPQKLSIFFILMFAIFITGCGEAIIGTNLAKGDMYYAKGEYQNAYACYMAAAQEYRSKIGKVYVSTADAKADAMKMVEAYYKCGLTCEQLAKDAEARENFENAMKDAINIKQSYDEKVPTYIPDAYVNQWVPAVYKDVWVDGHYKSVWKNSGYEDVWVDGTYEEVWVDGSYQEVYNVKKKKYESVWKDGYYKKKYVDGHYEKKKVDSRFEKVWVDGCYERTEVTPGHLEEFLIPAHTEYTTITKQKDATITLDKTYYALADNKLNKSSNTNNGNTVDNTTTNTTAVSADDGDVELKIAREEMQKAYKLYLESGSITPYMAAQRKYQQLLAAKKK